MIQIDFKDRRSIHTQLVDNITELVACGIFPTGSQLPSIRALATELSVNPNTVAKAFEELERNNVIISLKGRGNFVVEDITMLLKAKETEIIRKSEELAKLASTYGVPYDMLIEKISAVYTVYKEAKND